MINSQFFNIKMEALKASRAINRQIRTALKLGKIVCISKFITLCSKKWSILQAMQSNGFRFNYYREWKLANIETSFFLALKQFRYHSLRNDPVSKYYFSLLSQPGVSLETPTSIIYPDFPTLKQYLDSITARDIDAFEQNYQKFRKFMNIADDYYFKKRRVVIPSQRAKLLYNLNPATFKHQNSGGQL